MTKMKLEETAGKNRCSWCLFKDENVLHHADSDTCWHKGCFEAAGDVVHQVIDWLPSDKNSRS